MSIMDSTMIDLAATGALSNAGKPPTEGKPSIDGQGQPPAGEGARPASSDLISGILDKHGLGSPEELSEFLDSLVSLKGKIGDANPDELLKARQTLEAYHQEWAKQERDKLRENETPEETIARLEKELKQEQARKAKTERQQADAAKANQAVKAYADLSNQLATAEGLPAEYLPLYSEMMGIGSPINELDINNRADVRRVAKQTAEKVKAFEKAVIERYRTGKADLPVVPPVSGSNPPVSGEVKPKNLTESRALARTMLGKLLGR